METARGQRLETIDTLRGTVMVIMALDHVRDMVHRSAMSFSPTDLARTTPVLFLTRWVTHFCAPAFLFIAGISAFLWWQRNRTRRQLSIYLLTRGVWLVLLELTVMRLAYNFNFSPQEPILLLVLWVLGACMVLMAALVWLPVPALAALSVAAMVLHNGLDRAQASELSGWAGGLNALRQVGAFRLAGRTAVIGYPLVPWIAVMAAGFCFGRVFLMQPVARRRILVTLGSVLSVAFVALRAVNRYGDPAPWSTQPSRIGTLLSFLNCTKYPPSLAFLLMTLGPALLAFAAFDRVPSKRTRPLAVFGRVPLFYFVLHFYAAHAVAILLAWFRYGRASLAFVFHPLPSMGGPQQLFPPGFGYDLWAAYAVWALIVVALYPACRWFAGIKASRRGWWLSYL